MSSNAGFDKRKVGVDCWQTCETEYHVPRKQAARAEYEDRYGIPADVDKVWADREAHQDLRERNLKLRMEIGRAIFYGDSNAAVNTRIYSGIGAEQINTNSPSLPITYGVDIGKIGNLYLGGEDRADLDALYPGIFGW